MKIYGQPRMASVIAEAQKTGKDVLIRDAAQEGAGDPNRVSYIIPAGSPLAVLTYAGSPACLARIEIRGVAHPPLEPFDRPLREGEVEVSVW